MYDWPEVREATDLWWSIVAEALRAAGVERVPAALAREAPPDVLWSDPDLLISQTCGYPLTHAWAGRLQVLATPCYDVEGCNGADYCSFVLVRRDSAAAGVEDLRGARAAVNSDDSQSGYSALRAVVAPHARDGAFFAALKTSGAHLSSMQMVAEGAADVCAVDAVAWALARAHRQDLVQDLRVLTASPSAPGLPYVTSPARSPEEVACIRETLCASLEHSDFATVREHLYICAFKPLTLRDYGRIIEIEQASFRAGYPEIR